MTTHLNNNHAKTFDNVLSTILSVCKNHPNVNSVQHGDPWELNTDGGGIYPLCLVVPTSINTLDGEIQYNFNILCMDLVEPGESNELRVLSSTSTTLIDIISYFKKGGSAYPTPGYRDTNEWYHYTVDRATSFTMEPFTEKFTDNVAGWNLQFSINLHHDFSVCDWDMGFGKITDVDESGVVTASVGQSGGPIQQ